MKKTITITTLLLFVTLHLLAQTFSLTGTDPTYAQNFNTLPTSAVAWANNSTIPNWYSSYSGNVLVGAGAGSSLGIYSYGAASTTERALGSLAGNAQPTIEFGVIFTNNTGSTITRFDISFRGEQWRNGGNVNTQTLAFFYKVGATSINDAGFEAVSLLDFNSIVNTTPAAALDGNANSSSLTHSCTVNIPNGSTVVFKWVDINDSGGDHGFGVDDLNVQFINSVLPVELVSFEAQKVNQSVLTQWQTASEKNNAYFSLERSNDGRTFAPIATIYGAGTITTAQKYAYTDENPTDGINYYRLRQVDFDGTADVSKVVSVAVNASKTASKTAISAYPSTVENTLNVSIETKKAQAELTIIDLTGKIWLRQKNGKLSDNALETCCDTEGVQNVSLDLSFLPSGIYFLALRTTDGVETIKFQKL